MERNFNSGDFVLHFKHEMNFYDYPITKYLYIIKCIAINANNKSNCNQVVIYKNILTGNIYSRDYDEFISEVNHEQYPTIKQKYRFARCTALGKIINKGE